MNGRVSCSFEIYHLANAAKHHQSELLSRGCGTIDVYRRCNAKRGSKTGENTEGALTTWSVMAKSRKETIVVESCNEAVAKCSVSPPTSQRDPRPPSNHCEW
jgi:hypothetical protein